MQVETALLNMSVKQGGFKYHFRVFGMTQPGVELRSPVLLANTLAIRTNNTSFECDILLELIKSLYLSNRYTITVRNKFDTLQVILETHTLNDQ